MPPVQPFSCSRPSRLATVLFYLDWLVFISVPFHMLLFHIRQIILFTSLPPKSHNMVFLLKKNSFFILLAPFLRSIPNPSRSLWKFFVFVKSGPLRYVLSLDKLALGHMMYGHHLLAWVVSVNSLNSKASLGRGKESSCIVLQRMS